jgi:type IV pilus assembly protein PilA
MKTDPTPHQQGFSLIELMVVIVIIGVLGSIGIPAYKDYVVRAKISEFFSIVQPAKLAVTEALMSNAEPATINNASLGLGNMENIGVVENIIVANGIITITGNSRLLNIPGNTALRISLTPEINAVGITWRCSTSPAEFKKYVPKHCQADAAEAEA